MSHSALTIYSHFKHSVYQTFDGIDGKQCFRTQNSEVEEYADHAVDSISVTLNAVLLAAALQLGESPVQLGSNLMMALSAFFVAHWAAHSTNSLIFGRIDVTEAQWSMVAIHLVSAAAGPAIWDKIIIKTPLIDVKDAVCLATAATMFFASATNVAVALGLQETPLETNGVRIPRTPLTLWPMLTYLVICCGAGLCFVGGLLDLESVPTLLIIGLAMGKAGTAMIVQKLARKHGPMIDLASFSPLALYLFSKFPRMSSGTLHVGAWTLAFVLAADTCMFHEHATSDMKRARDIRRFILHDEPGQERPKDTGFYVSGGNLVSTQESWKAFAADAGRVKATYP